MTVVALADAHNYGRLHVLVFKIAVGQPAEARHAGTRPAAAGGSTMRRAAAGHGTHDRAVRAAEVLPGIDMPPRFAATTRKYSRCAAALAPLALAAARSAESRVGCAPGSAESGRTGHGAPLSCGCFAGAAAVAAARLRSSGSWTTHDEAEPWTITYGRAGSIGAALKPQHPAEPRSPTVRAVHARERRASGSRQDRLTPTPTSVDSSSDVADLPLELPEARRARELHQVELYIGCPSCSQRVRCMLGARCATARCTAGSATSVNGSLRSATGTARRTTHPSRRR
jgi:hypothetical protein